MFRLMISDCDCGMYKKIFVSLGNVKPECRWKGWSCFASGLKFIIFLIFFFSPVYEMVILMEGPIWPNDNGVVHPGQWVWLWFNPLTPYKSGARHCAAEHQTQEDPQQGAQDRVGVAAKWRAMYTRNASTVSTLLFVFLPFAIRSLLAGWLVWAWPDGCCIKLSSTFSYGEKIILEFVINFWIVRGHFYQGA